VLTDGWMTRVGQVGLGAAILLTVLIILNWSGAVAFANKFEAELKLFSAIFGVSATILGFWWGIKSKHDLKRDEDKFRKDLAAQDASSKNELIGMSQKLSLKSEEAGARSEESRQAKKELEKKKVDLQDLQRELMVKDEKIQFQQNQIQIISEGAADLWTLKKPSPFPLYREWLRAPQGAKIIAVGSQKGGVGKTTISGNLAAYISETLQKNVLLIDLDFQGSLSTMMLQPVDITEVESRSERLFEETPALATVSAQRIHLASKLKRGWIIPANYTFANRENQLLFQYIISDESQLDMRFRLARILLDPQVRREYAAIVIDMPPRLSLGSINALFASHFYLVPSILDKLSGEAVGRFIRQVWDLKEEFDLDVELLGLIGMMTKSEKLTGRDPEMWNELCFQASAWRDDVDYGLGTIPRRVTIANAVGDDIAYLLPGSQGDEVRALFDPVFRRICERLGLQAR
jgi:chromosome partitioning protein